MGEFKEEQKQMSAQMLMERIKGMPLFYRDYINGLSPDVVAYSSQALYAYNIMTFFEWLVDNNPAVRKGENKAEWIKNLTMEDMENITKIDANEYSVYLSARYAVKTTQSKLNAVSTMFIEFMRLSKMESNPFAIISRPKAKKHVITHLSEPEQKSFIECIYTGKGLTERQKKLQDAVRDRAIYTLFLDTGIRVSELCGINISDIDFFEHSIIVTRKGSDEEEIYMSDEAEIVLKDYLKVRARRLAAKGKKTDALFLNNRLGRISVRSVEKLTEQYTKNAGITKKISPHKLRSTFAMDFYEGSGDILLLKERMGHKNISTTNVYAEASKERQKASRNFRMA